MDIWARRALSAAAGSRARRRLFIFTFHRVLSELDPLLAGEPDVDRFSQLVEWFSKFLVVLPLSEAVRRMHAGSLPARAACITFDDGYANNWEVAKPILDRVGCPATFFVTTGAIEDGIMWNDLVIEGVRRCGDRLDLTDIDLGVWHTTEVGTRVAAIADLLAKLKYLEVGERQRLAWLIYRRYAGENPPSLMMTPSMLAGLVAGGHEVGSHTVSHPILASLPMADARRELVESRDWIEVATGTKPTSFAYPNGRRDVDFDDRHVRLLEEVGYACAVSTTWGCAHPGSSVYALERFLPWETTAGAFVKRLLFTYGRSYL